MAIGRRSLLPWEMGRERRAPAEGELVAAMADILRNGGDIDPIEMAPRCGVTITGMLEVIAAARGRIQAEREAAQPPVPLQLASDDRLKLNRQVSILRGLLERFRAENKVLYDIESSLLSALVRYERER